MATNRTIVPLQIALGALFLKLLRISTALTSRKASRHSIYF
jgi:hypothetical protein